MPDFYHGFCAAAVWGSKIIFNPNASNFGVYSRLTSCGVTHFNVPRQVPLFLAASKTCVKP